MRISVDGGAHHVAAQAFASSILATGKSCSKDRVVLSGPFKSRKLLRSQTWSKPVTKLQTIRRSCSANLDEGFDKHHKEGLAKRFSFSYDEDNQEQVVNSRWSSVTSEARLVATEMPSKFDLLEPRMLRIRPEPPDWLKRESVTWTIEQKAKSFDLPLSLRMIKKKQQFKRGFKDLEDSGSCSVRKAVSSMVYILVELQTYALQMREVLCDEDLEMIIEKVQREMHSSFLWLFQQVFSQAPALMIDMMILTANYGVYSTSHGVSIAEEEKKSTAALFHIGNSRGLMDSSQNLIREVPQVDDKDLRNIAEMVLWNSMVDEAAKMQSELRGAVLEHDVVQNFVSPISVEIEQDDYTEYHRTDLLYQTGLSHDPNNPLLLCNYAQFLYIFVRDYDRAEECFKRAIQLDPADGECLSQYAYFLWMIKKDLWGAEERYQQAADTEPMYSSKYAHFLWSTGAKDTCYPLDDN